MSGNSDQNPFVGPRPIQQGEALYGRSTEVRELFEQLQARRIVVLHSPSGAGKSSLVQAGLIPRLRQSKFDVWNPIRVNLDPADFEGLPEGQNRYLLSALISLEDELPAARRRSPAELATLGFLDYLEGRPRRKGRAAHSVVLLFDQFEEILSVAPRAVDMKEAFFAAVGEALDTGKYWALFIIREDYLAALAPYRDLLPTQLVNSYRLDLLGLAGAREAALKLAESGDRVFPAVDKLVSDLSAVQIQHADGSFTSEQGLHVEPVHLQVVCRRLWDAMPDDDRSIDEEDIEAYAGVSQSLAGYYADAVRAIAGSDAALERAIRDWVGTKLIVGGIRSQIRQEAGSSAGLDNRHIETLLDSYLVRTEQRAGANWFELSHDRLVEPIQADNEDWQRSHLHSLQVQARLWEDGGRAQALLLGADALPDAQAWAGQNPALLTEGEQEFLRLSQQLRADESRRRILRQAFTLALAAVAIVAIALGALALRSQKEAERSRDEAVSAQATAESARAQEATARSEAEAARSEAEAAQALAEAAQAENELLARRLLQQMFEVGLRRLILNLAADGVVGGEVEIDEQRWTPLLEHADQRFAAATVVEGGGRIIIAGHEAVLSKVDEHGNSLFLEISMKWLRDDQARSGVIIVSQQPGASYERLETVQRLLTTLAYSHAVDVLDDPDQLARAGMLIIDNRWASLSEAELATIEAFIARGGGVLAVGNGASWLTAERSPDEAPPTLDGYPMNQLLARYGGRWTEATIEPEQLEKFDQEANVHFTNRSTEKVKLLLRGEDDSEDYFATLDAGEELDARTALGQRWVIRHQNGSLVRRIVIDDKNKSVVIGRGGASRSDPDSARTDGLPKTLSNAAMKPALTKATSAAKTCGRQLGAIASRVKVKFQVSPAGKVTSADALPPLKGSAVGTCVAGAISKLSFPRSQSGVSKTWDLVLR